MRRLEIEFGFDLPEDLRARPRAWRAAPSTIKVEIADLNEDQEIKVPEDARPLSELQSQLGVAALGLGEGLGRAAARPEAAPPAARRAAARPAARPAAPRLLA